MKLIVCLSNHYYDADEYSMCPYCAEMVAMNGGSMFYYDEDDDYDDYYEEDYYDEEETEEVQGDEVANAEAPVEEVPVVEEDEPQNIEPEIPVATPPQYTYPETNTYNYNPPVEKEKKGFFSSLFKGKSNTSKQSSYPSYMDSWKKNSEKKSSTQKPDNSNVPDYLKSFNQKREARKKLNSTNIPDFVKGKATPSKEQEMTEAKYNKPIVPPEQLQGNAVANVQEQKPMEIKAESVVNVQEQMPVEVIAEPVVNVQEQNPVEIKAEPVVLIPEEKAEEVAEETINDSEILDVDDFINSIDISDEATDEAKPVNTTQPQTGMSFSESIADFLNRNLPDMENINTDLIGKVSADEEETEEEPDETAKPDEDMSFSEQIADFLKRNLPDMEGIDTDKIGKSTEENDGEQIKESSDDVEISNELEEEINAVINSLEILDEQPLTVGWLVCLNTDLKGESYTLINSENNLDRIIGGLLSKSIDTSIFYNQEENSLYIESNDESKISINETILNGKEKLNTYDRITIEENPSKKIELLFVSLCGEKFSW